MRGLRVVLLTIGLVLGCSGTTATIDAQRTVEPTSEAGTGAVEWCTGAVTLSNSSQGNSFCVTKTYGALWCWGSGGCGLLGSETSFITVPTLVTPQGLDTRFTSASVGWETTCAIEKTGGAACWGSPLPWAQPRCPGSPTVTEARGLPDQLTMITTGYDHACALAADGSAWCWGANTGGQLGDGTRTDRAAPAPVVGLDSGVAAISAGHADTCAIKTDGSLWCWGSNYAGELGDGTSDVRTAPVPVFGMSSGVAGVSVGGSHTCAVKTDGSAWCWGNNPEGALGDGTMEPRLAPARVELTSTAKAVAAGYAHTCAIVSDDTVWCWGTNLSGSLGYPASCDGGRRCPGPTPVLVSGLPPHVIALTAGYDSTCALERDGTVWCWGSNDSGQLGDGTRTARSTPRRVLPCQG